jgi:hypothetical protein
MEVCAPITSLLLELRQLADINNWIEDDAVDAKARDAAVKVMQPIIELRLECLQTAARLVPRLITMRSKRAEDSIGSTPFNGIPALMSNVLELLLKVVHALVDLLPFANLLPLEFQTKLQDICKSVPVLCSNIAKAIDVKVADKVATWSVTSWFSLWQLVQSDEVSDLEMSCTLLEQCLQRLKTQSQEASLTNAQLDELEKEVLLQWFAFGDTC